MKILLDTSTFLWFISDSDRLSSKARSHIADLENDLVLSIASLWEIAIKTSLPTAYTLPDSTANTLPSVPL